MASNEKRTIEKYKALLKSGETFSFNVINADLVTKTLKGVDGDVAIHLDLDDYYGRKIEENEIRFRAANVVGNPVEVVVTDVDEEKLIVKTSYSVIAKKLTEREKKLIDDGIKKGKPVTRRARVYHVFGQGAMAGCFVYLGSGLTGVIWVHDWSREYTVELTEEVKVGDEFDVVVYGANDSKVRVDYKCSRAETMKDPWLGIGKLYHRGDLCSVRCVGRWKEGYVGKLPSAPEINVRMRRVPKDKLGIYVGGTYICEVTRVSEEAHKFEVWPLRLLDTPDDTK